MLGLLFANAYAQEAATAVTQQPNALMSMMPLVMVFAIFYILMIRPQQEKVKNNKNT